MLLVYQALSYVVMSPEGVMVSAEPGRVLLAHQYYLCVKWRVLPCGHVVFKLFPGLWRLVCTRRPSLFCLGSELVASVSRPPPPQSVVVWSVGR